MITDARVLQPEFVPSEVQHRDAEVNHLSAALRPLIDGDPTDPVLIDGPPGVGKTCISRFTVERLREASVALNHQYVNCWEEYSRFKTLYQILDGVASTIDIHRQSTPTDVLLDRLRDYDGPPYIVILDEVDQLEDKSLLYDLYRVPEVMMVLIGNDEAQLFADLDDRLKNNPEIADAFGFNTDEIPHGDTFARAWRDRLEDLQESIETTAKTIDEIAVRFVLDVSRFHRA